MSNSLVSIIVPIYKVEKYLDPCISSLINQTYENIEIILVDDGSPDNCGTICDNYAKCCKKICVIHQKNQGVSVARNTGITASRGEWIIFVDGDDWVEHNMIEVMLERAETFQSDLCIGSYFEDYEGSVKFNYFKTLDGYVVSEEDKLALFTHCYDTKVLKNHNRSLNIGSPWAKLYRKELIDKNKLTFVPELKRSQDYVFNLYAFHFAHKIILMDPPLYHYRAFAASACHRHIPNFFEITDRIIKEYTQFYRKYYSKYDPSTLTNYLISIYIIRSTRLQFIPKESSLNYKQRIAGIKKIIACDPYKTAIHNVELKSLGFIKGGAILLLRLKFVNIFYLLLKRVHRIKLRRVYH